MQKQQIISSGNQGGAGVALGRGMRHHGPAPGTEGMQGAAAGAGTVSAGGAGHFASTPIAAGGGVKARGHKARAGAGAGLMMRRHAVQDSELLAGAGDQEGDARDTRRPRATPAQVRSATVLELVVGEVGVC